MTRYLYDGISDQHKASLHRQRDEFLWSLIDSSDLTDEQKVKISLILPLSPDNL